MKLCWTPPIAYNEPGVFMAFEETTPELAQNVASLGFDLNDLIARKKLAVDYVRVERAEALSQQQEMDRKQYNLERKRQVPEAQIALLRAEFEAETVFDNLKKLCEERLKGQYRIEVVDLLEKPTLAQDDQIVAIPTLVRKLPPPLRKIIGDLSNTERVLVGLQLRPGR